MANRLYNGDCLEILPKLDRVTCLFADPPDNIGLGYDQFNDRKTDQAYIDFLTQFTHICAQKADIVWISFNAKWTFAMGKIFNDIVKLYYCEAKACTQVFTFGQHNANDLGNNHRPLWRLRDLDAPLYPEQIKVPSWRQRNGDKRAAKGGRVPGDVFDMQYPSPVVNKIGSWLSAALDDPDVCPEMKADITEWFDTHEGDVFDFPRVTGNNPQRCDWHPTQLHEDLVERCLKLSTKPGDTVLDPFGGTGTTLRVCKRIKRPCTLIEMDSGYCKKIAKENGLTKRKAWWS